MRVFQTGSDTCLTALASLQLTPLGEEDSSAQPFKQVMCMYSTCQCAYIRFNLCTLYNMYVYMYVSIHVYLLYT